MFASANLEFLGLLRQVGERFERKDFRRAAQIADMAVCVAHGAGSDEDEVVAGFYAGLLYQMDRSYEQALRRYGDVIALASRVTTAGWDDNSVAVLLRTFSDWVNCAALIDTF